MSADSPRTLYLIDGTAQLFRAYFAIHGLTSRDGKPTNAIYGFTTMLRRLLDDERPDHVAAAFDLGGDVFRHAAFAEYKAHRPPVPEDLTAQFPGAKELCELLGVRVLELAGYEADDLIATYTRRAREAGFEVVIVATDKDLLQLVGPGVALLNPVKNLRLDAPAVEREFGVLPERVRDVLGLMGDAVDNIPGVPGVGQKTAISLVAAHGDLEAVLARAARVVALFEARDDLSRALDAAAGSDTAETLAQLVPKAAALDLALAEMDGADEPDDRARSLRRAIAEAEPESLGRAPAAERRKRVRALKRQIQELERGSQRRIWQAIHEHREVARLSRELATLHDDVPAAMTVADLARRPPERERLAPVLRALGFRTLLAELTGEAESAPAVERDAEREGGDAAPIVVTGVGALERVIDGCRTAGRVALQASADRPDPLVARLDGIALAWGDDGAAFVPLARDGAEPEPAARDALARLLADPHVPKLVHDLKRQAHLLGRHGLPVAGWGLDTMVAAFLLDPGRGNYALERLTELHLDVATPSRPRRPGMLELEGAEEAGTRLAGEARRILTLAGRLEPLLEGTGLRRLYDTIDGPLLPVLVEMEAAGIRVDAELLAGMSVRMEREISLLRAEVHSLAGLEFNVDSPKQLREVLFERLGLAPRRKTEKSRVASTDAQTLEELAADHAIARKLLDYRELAKLKGTYVDALPRLVRAETGRVHTWFDPTGAATGRLSSSDPNLQNIPARSAAGRTIRAAFVPAADHVFLSSDYSQVELRVLAHLSRDAELIAAFRAGEDIHRYTAARVFGVAPDAVTDVMRRRAKAVNFGILYGMSETRLAREQGLGRTEARRFIQAYFERFAGVRRYIDETRAAVRRDGVVRTLFGRVRYFPQLQQRVHRGEQEQALRAAVNTTIQGTAADLMKLAMLRVHDALGARDTGARMLLQVHDELLLEVPSTRIDDVRPMVRAAMEGVADLVVPLVVDQKAGRSWLEAT